MNRCFVKILDGLGFCCINHMRLGCATVAFVQAEEFFDLNLASHLTDTFTRVFPIGEDVYKRYYYFKCNKCGNTKAAGILDWVDLEEDDMSEIIALNESEVKAYLDRNITEWRGDLKSASSEKSILIAKCYIDAFQSVRCSLFGELLAG